MIRLRVAYRSAQALVTAYTTSLTRGGCLLASHKEVEVGSIFLFEMVCLDLEAIDHPIAPVELEGEVVRVRPIYGTTLTYELAVQYRAPSREQAALVALIASFDVELGYPTLREFPRIPVNLPVDDSHGGSRCYVLRDLSHGGMRIECQDGICEVPVGRRVHLAIRRSTASEPAIFIEGTVRWNRVDPAGDKGQFGVEFEDLGARQHEVLESLTQLMRPHQVLLHLGASVARATSVDDGARQRRVGAAKVGEVLSELAKQELAISLGLAVTDAVAADRLSHAPVCVARVGLTGDLSGEIVLRTGVGLSAAIASQIADEVVALDDLPALEDALREFVIGLGGGVCDRLETAGYDVSLTAPLTGAVPPAEPGDQIHTVVLSGPRGVAELSIYSRSRSARRSSSRGRDGGPADAPPRG